MADATKTVNRRSFDWRPFAAAARKLETDPGAWIETNDLIAGLQWNQRDAIPEVVLGHLRRRLDGTARKRRGQERRDAAPRLRETLIALFFYEYETWLVHRHKSQGLGGWPSIRDAEWWQGAPSERAARMVCHHFELDITWERARNIAYEERLRWQAGAAKL